MSRFDYVIVGAGIVGSCTALQLAKYKKNVLLLEQFSLPHSRGSSHGSSRLIRSCYAEPFFAEMMPHAFAIWREIEKDSGTTLIENRGGALCISDASDATGEFSRSISNMQLYSPEHLEELDAAVPLSDRYPTLRFDRSYKVFLDKSGGTVLANKALSAVQTLFKDMGGELWDGCSVEDIRPGNDVTVVTSRGPVVAPSVIICAGTWTKKLLTPRLVPDLPLEPAAVKVYYWKEREVGLFTQEKGFPAFIDISCHPHSIYGLPSIEYPGLVKVCIHGGVPCDPDARERAQHDSEFESALKAFVKEHLPGLEPEPAVVETCMYTLTPDEVFIVDVLPDHPNIVIATGFSGTGFKIAPIVGRLVSQLAEGVSTSLDMTPFSLARFQQK